MNPEALSLLVTVATARLTELRIEFERLKPAADYMQQLLDLIDGHPLLADEWAHFLVRADLPKPEFRMTFEERVLAHRIEIGQGMLTQTKRAISEYEQQLVPIRAKGEYYLMMQRRILASPEAMDAWQNFMISVQLLLDDRIAGITH